MAIFDFSTAVNNIDFTKYGLWQAVSCPIEVPQVTAFNEPVGLCAEDTIYNYNGTCYQCIAFQDASPNKLMINDVIRWAKMTLYFDENTGSSVSDKTVYYKRPYGTLPTTSKTGYTFNGWFTDETWGTEVTAVTICNQIDNHTLYAKLDINYYTITYLDYDGNFVADYSVAYGTTPPIPTGTPDDAQYDYSWPTVAPATADVTYQETRVVKNYVVKWRDYTGAILKQEVLAYGATSTAPTGTSDTAQYDYEWPQSSVVVTGTTTITETRALKYYTVNWKQGSTTLKTESVPYGGDGTPPADPTQTGYTFVGWIGDYTGITGNVTILADFDVNSYILTISSITGVASQTITRTSSPNAGASTGVTLGNGATIYYGDVLTINATASSGYSVSVSGSPVTVTGNVVTSNYINVSYAPQQPMITYQSRTATTLLFTVKNQAPYAARIYYEHSDSTPEASYVDLAAGATSGTLSVSGLTPETSYNVYAQADKDGAKSSSVYFSYVTDSLIAPEVSYVSNTENSITLEITNYNGVDVTAYYEHTDTTPDAASVIVPSGDSVQVTVSGLSAGTWYYIYVQFSYAGKTSSVENIYNKTVSPGATNWVYENFHFSNASAYTYNGSTTKFGTGSCQNTTEIDASLTSSHPPGNYNVGYVMRVTSYTQKLGSLCGYYWYRAY
jgi:uncharacterized repeat protein (TIGR02543 family)